MSPPDECDFFFRIDHDGIHWLAPNSMVWAWWHDAAETQWRRKSVFLRGAHQCTTRLALQAPVDVAVQQLYEWLLEHHTPPITDGEEGVDEERSVGEKSDEDAEEDKGLNPTAGEEEEVD